MDETGLTTNQQDELPANGPHPARKNRYRVIISTVAAIAALFALVLLYQRFSPFLVPDVPGVTLTDINSIDDLRTRFNQAAGETRLILFVSPT